MTSIASLGHTLASHSHPHASLRSWPCKQQGINQILTLNPDVFKASGICSRTDDLHACIKINFDGGPECTATNPSFSLTQPGAVASSVRRIPGFWHMSIFVTTPMVRAPAGSWLLAIVKASCVEKSWVAGNTHKIILAAPTGIYQSMVSSQFLYCGCRVYAWLLDVLRHIKASQLLRSSAPGDLKSFGFHIQLQLLHDQLYTL